MRSNSSPFAVVTHTLLASLLAAQAVAQTPQLAPDTGRSAADFECFGRRIVTGDLDGDRRDDVIVGPSTLEIRLSLPSGGWQAVAVAPAIGGVGMHALADADRDGDLDLVVGRSGRGFWAIGVYANDGTGRFQSYTESSYALPATVNVFWNTVVVDDLNADGADDLLFGALFFNTPAVPPPPPEPDSGLFLAFGDGQGGFAAPALQFVSRRAAVTGAALDADGDGDLDLVAASFAAPPQWLENRANVWGPQPGVLPPTLPVMRQFAAADLDRDGDVDLVGRSEAGEILQLDNVGGTFTSRSLVNPDPTARFVLGDFDGDGFTDLAVGGVQSADWFANDGAGNFPGASRVLDRQLPAEDLAAADVDADGDTDLVTLWGPSSRQPGVRTAAVVPGTPAGPRADPHLDFDLQLDRGALFGRASGDVDGDGFADAILALSSTSVVPTSLSTYRSLGAGRYRVRHVPRAPDRSARALSLADLDGDRDLDLIQLASRETLLWRNDGAGGFTLWTTISTGALGGVVHGDVDGDGDVDLVTTLTLYRNDGVGRFHLETLPSSGGGGSSAVASALVDVDGDGDLDVLAPTGIGSGRDVLLNDGTGTFTVASGPLPFPAAPWGIAAADADGDGDPDVILFGQPDNRPRLFANDGAGGFTEVTSQRLPRWPAGASQIVDVHWADLDDDDHVDLLIGQLDGPTIYRNDGGGRFTDVTATFATRGIGRYATALADLDLDGDVDAVIGDEVHWNHERHLIAIAAPVRGGALSVRSIQEASRRSADRIAALVVGLGAPATPIRLPGVRGRLQLDPALPLVEVGVLVADGFGRIDWTIPVPNSPQLAGVDVHLQALAVSPRSVGLTNPLVQRIR